MSKDMIDALTQAGANITITMTAEELREFAADIAHITAERVALQTVDAIKDAMGDTMKYCTTEEAVRDYKIKLPTLNSWIAKGLIIPLKKGRKNLYLRTELLRLTQRKIG
jgi:hypothetical protein